MAFSIQRAVSDGTLQTLPVSLTFFERSDIHAFIDGAEVTNYVWLANTSIRFDSPIPDGVEVMLRRITDMSEPRHIFSLGSPFTYKTLDEDFEQILRIAQEAVEGLYVGDLYNNLNMHGYRITNLGDPSDLGDAVSYRFARQMVEEALAGSTNGQGWFLQDGMHSVARTLQSKLRDLVSVRDFGATPNTGTDQAAYFVNALNAATQLNTQLYVPAGIFDITLTQANAATILSMLNRVRVDGFVAITVPTNIVLTSQVPVNSPEANRISIVGNAPIVRTTLSHVSTAGVAFNYLTVWDVGPTAGMVVGDYVTIRDGAGTGDYYAHQGTWQITAVGATTITVRNTHQAATFPVNTVTSMRATVLKTRITFNGCDAFRFEGVQPLARFDRLAIEGDWNLAANTGTTGAHGIVICAPIVTPGGDSNANYAPSGNCIAGPTMAVVKFGEQGVAVSGRGHMVGNYLSVCSNRKRGWYAEGGHIRAKLGLGCGNGEDGYISDVGGAIQAALCVASGNRLNGFWCFNNSALMAATARATGNGTNGFECRGTGRLGASSSRAIGNGGSGYSAGLGGEIACAGATAEENTHGFDSVTGGNISCDDSVSRNNTGYGYRSQYGSFLRATGGTVSGNGSGSYLVRDCSVMFDVNGAVVVQDTPTYSVGYRVYNPAKTLYYGLSVTTIGDLSMIANGTGRWTFKADGTLQPATDGTHSVGSSGNRVNTYWAVNGTISTSDARLKTGIRKLTADEVAAACDLGDELGVWQWAERVAVEGTDARLHSGTTVQHAMEIMERHNLDPFAYSFICYDVWDDVWEDVPAVTEEDERGLPVEVEPATRVLVTAAGDRYSFRMQELLAFVMAGTRAQTRSILERLDALEAK